MWLYNRFVGFPNSFKLALKLFLIFFIFIYFVFHAITGENGLFSYIDIKDQVKESAEKLEILKQEKDYLDNITALLSDKTLDLDILEERCRVILNYAYPKEIVVRNSTIP